MPMAEKKIVIVGDGESGKTCLVRKYFEFRYTDVYVPTVFDSFTTIVQTNGRMVKLELWDTAGQDDYDRLRPLSYPNTDVVIVCYSVERPDSLVNVTAKWMPEVWFHCKDVPVVLVGNKKDLRDDPVPVVPLNGGGGGGGGIATVGDDGRAPLAPVADGNANRRSRDPGPDRPEDEESGKGSDRKPDDAERIREDRPVTDPWDTFAADENSTPEELDCQVVKQTMLSTHQGQEVATRIGAFAFLECSAKTHEGVDEVFLAVVQASTIKDKKQCILL